MAIEAGTVVGRERDRDRCRGRAESTQLRGGVRRERNRNGGTWTAATTVRNKRPAMNNQVRVRAFRSKRNRSTRRRRKRPIDTRYCFNYREMCSCSYFVRPRESFFYLFFASERTGATFN